MSHLSFEIPNSTHQQLKIRAAENGVSIKDFVLDCLAAKLGSKAESEDDLAVAMAEWEEKRKNLKLNRGDKTWHEIIHEGHKW